MPYIKKEDRAKYDSLILGMIDVLRTTPNENLSGELNYIFSSMMLKLFNDQKNYNRASTLISAIECSKLEFYRRYIVPYEDEKIEQNGDI